MSPYRIVLPPMDKPKLDEKSNHDFSRWLQSTLDDDYYTPDGPLLYMHEFQYIFVYGTLKHGFSRNTTLATNKGEIIGPAHTLAQGYSMHRTSSKYTYPVILSEVDKQKRGSVQGEVWKIPTRLIYDLDFIESNGEMYDRRKIGVEVLLGKQRKPHKMVAWAYIGRNDFWVTSTVKPKLIPCELLTSNKDPQHKYYAFMRKYEKPQTK
jgi:gamma-glutamylcyclotransferase (GGCT)/AIG2-like uncharacterized protein YtfP